MSPIPGNPNVQTDMQSMARWNSSDGDCCTRVGRSLPGPVSGTDDHRALYLGCGPSRRSHMLTAADIMTTDVISVAPDTPIQDVAKLLYTRHISGVPVIDADQRVVGIVSEGDLITSEAAIGGRRPSWWLTLFADDNALARDYARTHGRTARDLMTTDVITVAETTSLMEIARILERHRIKRVPVVRDGR